MQLFLNQHLFHLADDGIMHIVIIPAKRLAVGETLFFHLLNVLFFQHNNDACFLKISGVAVKDRRQSRGLGFIDISARLTAADFMDRLIVPVKA